MNLTDAIQLLQDEGELVRIPLQDESATKMSDRVGKRLDELTGHTKLLGKAHKIKVWLLRLALQSEAQAKGSRFQTLVEACQADAKNYRAVARDLSEAIAVAEAPASPPNLEREDDGEE